MYYLVVSLARVSAPFAIPFCTYLVEMVGFFLSILGMGKWYHSTLSVFQFSYCREVLKLKMLAINALSDFSYDC